MTRQLILLACLAFAPWTHASDCTATSPPAGALVGQGLLDPATPDAERQRLGDALMCSALAGNASSQEIAGSLYRWGPRHPAHVFPEDHARARDLLTAAASQGRLGAMLKLAELELADGHPREAMIWVQVEGQFYRRREGKADVVEDTTVASYYVMLLKRATDALGRWDVAALDREIDARIAMVEAQIAALPPHHDRSPPLSRGKVPPQQRMHGASPTDIQEGAYAQFFAEIGPDGRVARSWLIDAYPNPGSGLRVSRALQEVRWNALPAGDTTMRYAIVPLTVASLQRSIHLKS
ncbi:hypothetical protein P3W33_05655 [Luteibacter sp. PPL552]